MNRDDWIKLNRYYYQDLVNFYKHSIPQGKKILEIGCGTGFLLNSLKPKVGIGIDTSQGLIKQAKNNYPRLTFLEMNGEQLKIKGDFDFIILSDTVGYLEDVQKVFQQLRNVSTPQTRIILNFQSYLWLPILNLAERLNLKMPSQRLNWLNNEDIKGLLELTGFEVIKKGRRMLFPKSIPVISSLFNKYLSQLPLVNKLCITNFIVAKQIVNNPSNNKLFSVSVVIPARNEKGNIEQAVKRTPNMGKSTEIIFIEGHSKDATLEEIKRVHKKYSGKRDLKYAVQKGKGKGDAVRLGFDKARGDILMILDADLTVPPEDLTKFYNAYATGKGEFINGSRLVYPMENEAMRTLNILGNKFFSMMFTWLLGQRLKDTLCGTKVISKLDYERLIANRGYFGNFDPFGDFDLLFGAAKLNLKIIEVPIRYRARTYGSTNISRFKHGWLLLKMVIFAMDRIKFI